MCKIYTINKYTSINRKIVKTNVFSAQLIRSIILNPDVSFRQSFDQLAALQASGQKLVMKTYF